MDFYNSRHYKGMVSETANSFTTGAVMLAVAFVFSLIWVVVKKFLVPPTPPPSKKSSTASLKQVQQQQQQQQQQQFIKQQVQFQETTQQIKI